MYIIDCINMYFSLIGLLSGFRVIMLAVIVFGLPGCSLLLSMRLQFRSARLDLIQSDRSLPRRRVSFGQSTTDQT